MCLISGINRIYTNKIRPNISDWLQSLIILMDVAISYV